MMPPFFHLLIQKLPILLLSVLLDIYWILYELPHFYISFKRAFFPALVYQGCLYKETAYEDILSLWNK